MPTFNADGLIPAIVQDTDTGEVLMMAWMNEDAVAATHATGHATFWSRSRNELWEKGATSGNTLHVTGVFTDCDEDTLLVRARPTGPSCHTGTRTCFADAALPRVATLGTLAATIDARAAQRPTDSYTTKLLDNPELAARKVLEEAGEVAFAAKDVTVDPSARSHLTEELADLTYHLLVLAKAHDIDVADISQELAKRDQSVS